MMLSRTVRFHDHDSVPNPDDYVSISPQSPRSPMSARDSGSASGSEDEGHSPNDALEHGMLRPDFEEDYPDDDLPVGGISGPGMAELAIRNGVYAITPWGSARPRSGSISGFPPFDPTATHSSEPGISRPQRPPLPARAPSNSYAPQRHPTILPNLSQLPQVRTRSTSANRSRRDPNAQYHAQEKAYVQRLRQDNPSDSYFGSNSLIYTESDAEDDSPSADSHIDQDLYETDTFLLYGQDDMDPSTEELKIPENRERLEWHTMLSSVLRGDVVKQEKKRMIGSSLENQAQITRTEIWVGIRAKVCGRSVAAQRRVMEDGQATVDSVIDEIINFQIVRGDITITPRVQVRELIQRWEKCENMFPHRKAMAETKPKVVSDAFVQSWDAIVSWHNVTEMMSTELAILQSWVGNQELNFGKPVVVDTAKGNLSDDSSFLDHIIKEDGLKSLVGDRNMLKGISAIVGKAKKTLIENHCAFEKRQLPPYIDEMLLLINFPTRLIEEIIQIRLKYAKKIREPASIMVDQFIQQFQAILRLAVQIKQEYTNISRPERGWDLPSCMDENFEQVVLDGLKFYFKLLNWKLSGNKNTFKEAEILENEWHFSNSIGRFIDGGDVQVAEEFR